MNRAVLRLKKSAFIVLLFFCLLSCAALFAAETQTELTAEKPVTHVESRSEAHGPGLFDFNLGILISQTINFFVLLFLLKKFLFVPIGKVIDERRDHLGRIKIAAEAEHQKALEFKAVYEEHLAKIEAEMYAIKQQAILDANQKVEEIIEEARKKAERIVEKGELDIFMERQTAWASVREGVVQLTLMAAEKLVEESLDDPMHRRLIQNTIERLENNLPDFRQ